MTAGVFLTALTTLPKAALFQAQGCDATAHALNAEVTITSNYNRLGIIFAVDGDRIMGAGAVTLKADHPWVFFGGCLRQADKGRGVGRDEAGRVYFIKETAPGDVVNVQVLRKKKSFFGWSNTSKPRLHIAADAVVEGRILLQQEVELQLDNPAMQAKVVYDINDGR